ncbi:MULTISPECIES: sugar-transfer associated ATP-grasp domain-containing protein [Sphingobium]|uniref:Alpha-L-glutamate ligase-related protein ATP-grasp domain-containing protein n=1 Tax=Sphingobium fuliginis ATCC 27551 TaxID=1208342 RepID=A0A5B8CAV3_SPHSA|nr:MULTISPECIES: sugar-transfer associated ATP-grasp domain-containing protein [Sphingobium]QDC35885.1 hypothetical protein FIL70_00135 [Sphingobium fuliginis ATCC 27551]UXC90943.1 hypothetical protein EGM87_00145 [Sphingobium sp. RSMS]
MFTLRALPAGSGDNELMAAYHRGLRSHWSLSRWVLARLLAEAGQGGWSRAERAMLSEAARAQGLSMRDRKGLHRLLNPGAFPLAANPLKNKRLFARLVREAGLPAPDSHDPEREALAQWLGRHHDIIAKPSYTSRGRGVERFVRDGDRWRGGHRRLSETALLARLHRQWARGGVIQQRLATHPALEPVSPGALPTLRVVTVLDERGAPEACALALRLSAGEGRPVDNFNAGNLVLAVDDAGRCGAAWRGGMGRVRPGRHPATGAMLEGMMLPDRDAAEALALAAHRRFREGFAVIGWDIGLTAQGPALIEGNWNPGTDIVQLVSGRGVGTGRMGALYRHHLDRLPDRRWRTARAIETEARR